MDVRCSRCSTEYEFDDALISERGTTVKCTNCGFQFKIFPSEGQGIAPERWVVRIATGRELVYTSLRELQRGIAEKKVGANDLLSRGKQPPRPLGSIAELEPFFQVTSGKRSDEAERTQRTLHGVAPPPKSLSMAGASEFAPPATEELPALTTTDVLPDTELAPPPARPVAPEPSMFAEARSTLPGGSLAQVPSSPAAVPAPSPPRESIPDSARSSFPGTPMSPRVSSFDATLEVPTSVRSPVSSPRNLPPFEVANIRDSFKSYDELQLDTATEDLHSRVVRSRWIAGVVVVGVLGLFGATVGRRYLARLAGAVEVQATSDARVAKFLSDGARLADDGDFEGAKEELDKATALAEKDPAVLTALARLETLRADASWLKLRLLDPTSTDLVQATHRELGRRVGKAQAAVDRAFAVSPEDPAVLRARVDALRLSGDGDRAREWLSPLSANASVPENAYVLAALDLAEASPVWPTVIDRLRTAAAAERDPGRARAALIYALARADRLSEAESEFAKIDGRAKPHPLLEELRSYLQRAKAPAATAGSAAPKPAAVDTAKLPKLDTSPAPDEPRAAAVSDFRTRLAQAASALHQGKLARAEQLYNSVLSEQPGNTEALAGLGDVAKARRDPTTAARMYDRVLAANPSYLPAILASADQKWEAGDRANALVLYRRLLEEAGPSSEYGARAAARIAQSSAAPKATSSATGGAAKAPAAPTDNDAPAAPSKPQPPPGIDTTDLP